MRFLSSSMILASSDLPDVRLQVADPAQLDERRGQEAAQADVEDEAALDDLDDRTRDDAVLFLDALDVAPGPLVLRPLLGQDEAAVLVLLGEDQRLDLVAQRHDLVGVDVVADRQLAAGDHALGLVPDVEEDLVTVDPHHRAGHDRAVLDGDEGGVDGVGEADAQIVVDDLAGGVAVLGRLHLVGGRGRRGAGLGSGGVGGLDVGHEQTGFRWEQGIRCDTASPGAADAQGRARGARTARLAGTSHRPLRPVADFRRLSFGATCGPPPGPTVKRRGVRPPGGTRASRSTVGAAAYSPGVTDHRSRTRSPARSASRRSSRGVKQVVHRSTSVGLPCSSRTSVRSWFTPAPASKLSASSRYRTWK